MDQPVRVLARRTPDKMQLELVLTNGLVSRTFYVSENLACISYCNLANGAEYVRSIQPEARVQLDGTWYEVGGLKGQRLKAYLMRDWLPELHDGGTGFQFVGLEIGQPKKPLSLAATLQLRRPRLAAERVYDSPWSTGYRPMWAAPNTAAPMSRSITSSTSGRR